MKSIDIIKNAIGKAGRPNVSNINVFRDYDAIKYTATFVAWRRIPIRLYCELRICEGKKVVWVSHDKIVWGLVDLFFWQTVARFLAEV